MSKEFDNALEKILNAIDSIEPSTPLELKEIMAIEYIMAKFCESEEIFHDNIKILDKHSKNGLKANKERKFR